MSHKKQKFLIPYAGHDREEKRRARTNVEPDGMTRFQRKRIVQALEFGFDRERIMKSVGVSEAQIAAVARRLEV